MKKIKIFEPAMCCPTGLCGVGVDPELLRISTVLSNLEKKGLVIERFNLTNSPMEFMTQDDVNALINEKGIEVLPVTVLDGEVMVTGRYPTNEELASYLEIPFESFNTQSAEAK